MRNSPTVSVIIPTYNCANYLAAAVESALSQTYQNVEIVIVDDGSTDNTWDVLQPFVTQIKYFRHRNRGLSVARNIGIQHSTGELLAFLDADDIWHSDKLHTQIQAFRQYPQAGLSFTNHESFDDYGGSRAPGLSNNVMVWLKKHQTHDTEIAYGSMYRDFLGGDCMHVSSAIVTRAAINDVGLFDEEFKICQDFDLWLRISRKYPVIGVNRLLSRYRYRPDSLSGATDVRIFRWHEEMCMVLAKHLRNAWVPAEFQDIAKDTLTRLSWNVGWTHFRQNRLKEARPLFLWCARSKPFMIQPWIYWAACFLPVLLVERLRRVKRRQALYKDTQARPTS